MTAVVTGGSPQVFINGLEAARKSDTTDGVTEADATNIATSVAGSVVSSTLGNMQQAIAWGSATLNSVNSVFQMTAPLIVPPFTGSSNAANNMVPTVDLVQQMITGGGVVFPITVSQGGTGTSNNTAASGSLLIGNGTAFLSTSISGDETLYANGYVKLTSSANTRTNLGLATVANTGVYSDLGGKPFGIDGANNLSFNAGVIYNASSFSLASNNYYTNFLNDGRVIVSGTFSANNFSGNSSGVNTGDQTIPTTLPPSGAAGGMLSGTYPNPTSNTSATVTFANVTAGGTLSVNGAATFSNTVTLSANPTANLQAATKQYVDAQVGGGTTPTGAAGGILSGTYPNPTSNSTALVTFGNVSVANNGSIDGNGLDWRNANGASFIDMYGNTARFFGTVGANNPTYIWSFDMGNGTLICPGPLFATTGTFSGVIDAHIAGIDIPSFAGTASIVRGNADAASITQYDVAFNSWWGIGFPTYNGSNYATLDTRSGSWMLAGDMSSATVHVGGIAIYNDAGYLNIAGAWIKASTIFASGSITSNGQISSGGNGNSAVVLNYSTAISSIANSTAGLGMMLINAPYPGGVYQANAASFIAFNRTGNYAAYFGLDVDNLWKVGGWSMGANAYKIIHEGLTGSANINAGLSFQVGQNWGSATASSATDLSRHVALWGTNYGFNVTAGTLNLVTNGAVYPFTAGLLTCPGGITAAGNTTSYGYVCTTDWYRVNGNNGIYFSTWGSGWHMQDSTYVRTYSGGNHACMASDFVLSSDAKLKDEIIDLESRPRLRPRSFRWKANNHVDIGFIAQEVEENYPEVIGQAKDADGKSETKVLSYSKLTVVLSKQVNDLEDTVKKQQETINDLQRRLTQLETWMDQNGALK